MGRPIISLYLGFTVAHRTRWAVQPRADPPPFTGGSYEQKRRYRRRVAVWNKTGGYCVYCSEPLNFRQFHIDHVVPRNSGGADHLTNMLPACSSCNTSKNCHSYSDWIAAVGEDFA